MSLAQTGQLLWKGASGLPSHEAWSISFFTGRNLSCFLRCTLPLYLVVGIWWTRGRSSNCGSRSCSGRWLLQSSGRSCSFLTPPVSSEEGLTLCLTLWFFFFLIHHEAKVVWEKCSVSVTLALMRSVFCWVRSRTFCFPHSVIPVLGRHHPPTMLFLLHTCKWKAKCKDTPIGC